jgi:hypothetical protein
VSDLSRLLGAANLDRTSDDDLADLFEEIPPPLDVFVSDRQYLGAALGTKFELSPIQWDLVRHIEQVYFPSTIQLLAEQEVKKERLVVGSYVTYREKPYWGEPIRMTNKITAMWGKGAGKDNTVRVATLRVINLLLSLKSPQLYYDMPDADSIHTLNVATNARQAMLAFFDPIKRAVKKGWFEDKCNPTMNQVEFDKNVLAISGHSDAESQEGLNLLLGIADEIDAFPSALDGKRKGASSITNSAEHIMNMMDSSASTRFPDIYKLVAISYPRYLGSPIMSLIQEGKENIEEEGAASTSYVSGPYATWDVNPRVTGPEKFASQYKKDPIEAAAKYECKPARAVNPYFRNEAAVKSVFHEVETEPVRVKYVEDGHSWKPDYDFSRDFKPIHGARYSMHGDLALNGDRAGVAMAHVISQEEFEDTIYDEDGAEIHVREMRPNVKVDFVISYEADISSKPAREIQIRWARQLCFELIKMGFNIQRFTFDGFQSLDSMQILEERGIESERVSTDRSTEPWKNLKDLIHDGRIWIPKRDLVQNELLSLNQLPNGKVDHPTTGSKDEADALACAALGAVFLGGEEDPDGGEARYEEFEILVGNRIEKFAGFEVENMWYDDPSDF